MKNVSVIHILERFVRLVYALAVARIFHEIVNLTFFSFSCQTYLLSSVSLRLFSCLNDIWWFRHIVLNSVAVRPTNFSVFPPVVTVAWYICLISLNVATRFSPGFRPVQCPKSRGLAVLVGTAG